MFSSRLCSLILKKKSTIFLSVCVLIKQETPVGVERKHGLFVLGLWGRCGRGVRQGTRAVRGMTDMSNQDDGILGGVGN